MAAGESDVRGGSGGAKEAANCARSQLGHLFREPRGRSRLGICQIKILLVND